MSEPVDRILRAARPGIGVVLLAGGMAAALSLPSYVPHVAGLVAAGIGALLIVRSLRLYIRPGVQASSTRSLMSRIAFEAAAPALVALATCGLYWYLTAGMMPWHGDHPVHLYKAWHLGEKLIPTGRLTGWSNFWWTGYPAGSTYPLLGDLLTVIIRALTFGLAPWPMAYAWTLLVTQLTYNLGIYAVGRRWFGRWAGAAAAMLALLDRGGPREGGWFWTIDNGVWPMALATGLWFFALDRFNATLEKPTSGRVAGLAVTMALALLAHPMTLTYSAALFPMLWVLHALRAEQGRIALPVWATIGGIGLGGLLASFWYIPFVLNSEYVEKVGDAWWTLPEIGDKIASSSLFEGTWRITIVLGLTGAVYAWTRAHRVGREVSVMAALLILLISSTVAGVLELGDLSESINAVHFRRFTYLLKLLWFCLAGYAIAGAEGEPAWLAAFQASLQADPSAGRAPTRSVTDWRMWLRSALAIAIFVPILESVLVSLYYAPVRDMGQRWNLEDAVHSTPFRESNSWFRDHVKRSGPFFRIAYEVGGSGHLFYSAPLFTGRPAVVLSMYTSAEIFSRQFSSNSASTFELQHVRYAVALSDIFEKRADMKQVHRSGITRIYELTSWSPDPFEVKGEARCKLLEFGDERIRIDVRGSAPGDRITLHVTQTRNWRVTLAGRSVPIKTVDGNGQVKWLMNVPIDRDGVLELRYVNEWPEWAGIAGSAAGVLGFILLLASGPLARRLARTSTVPRRACSIVAGIAGPVLAAIAVAAVAAGGIVLARDRDQPDGWQLSDHFAQARVSASGGGLQIKCEPIFDRRIKCENGQTLFLYTGAKRSGTRHSSRILTGILLRPFNKLHLVLRFGSVKLGRAIESRCGSDYLDKGNGHVQIEFHDGTNTIAKTNCPSDGSWKKERLDTSAWKGKKVALHVDVANSSSPSPMLVLDAWIVK